MINCDALTDYLNDHLSGADAGVALARRISDQAGGGLTDLVSDIETDRKVLARLVEEVGDRRHSVKEVMGAVTERLSRLVLNPSLVGSAELVRLMEMEMLSMGIQGKVDLWETLARLADQDADGVLAGYDFASLTDRAHDQQARLSAHRTSQAEATFLAAAPGAGPGAQPGSTASSAQANS